LTSCCIGKDLGWEIETFRDVSRGKSMSQEGILKYPSPLLVHLEGPEICLHDRSIPIGILTKNILP